MKLITTGLLTAATAFAANTADDIASNAPYADGWQTADNGGSGLGAWTLNSGGLGGHFIGATGEGPDPSFGLFAGATGGSGTNFATAVRSFTGGALTSGQTFSIDLGHTATNDGTIGLNLRDGGSNVVSLTHESGELNWELNDGGSDFSSGQAFAADTELSFSFTYEGGSSYSYTFGGGSGSNFTASNTISGIDGFELFSTEQGGGQNLGANDVSVVPEPGTFALLAGALAFVAVALRNRKSA